MVKRNIKKNKKLAPELKVHKPRILWANTFCLLDTSSGASISAREMLRQLAFHGYDVCIVGATIFDSEKGISRFPENWKSMVSEKNNILQVHDAPLEHKLFATKSTRRSEMTAKEADLWFSLYVQTLDAFKPDLVFFYGGQTLDLLIPDEARQRNIPSAAYLVNGNYNGARWYRDVTLIITDSQATADFYERQDGIKPVPVGTFIEPSTVTAIEQTRKNLLFINPSLEKGASIVIQLAMLLEKKRPDIQFEVVESRGNWQALVKLITSQSGDAPREELSNVIVTPNTNDMRPIYGRARLILAPSLWWESGSRVLAEAMLNAIPAIVTDRGGSPEMIGIGGMKIQLPDVCHEKPYTAFPKPELLQPLVERIIQLYDDERFYNDYVIRAKHVGETLHNMANSTQRLIQAFKPHVQQVAGDTTDRAKTE
jgi:glycosyltransferase involved in cell wall biosynthesis